MFRIPLFVFLTSLLAQPLGAQNPALVQVEENIRAEPQGTIIGRAEAGSEVTVLRMDGRWAEVELVGWVWTPSLQVTDRAGFDRRISATPEENLRTEPSGAVEARLLEGALLEELRTVPGWTEVRRVAWMWGPSLEVLDRPASPTRIPAAGSGPDPSTSWWRSGEGGAAVLTGPDGDTLATSFPGAEMQVLARQGNWLRVRMEGWVWTPEGAESDSTAVAIVSEVTPAEVVRDPGAFRGHVVSWDLNFVSREEAERVRTDFYEGEPFLLTRAATGERMFVYVAIPPERLQEIEGLVPLEGIRVVGRIRTGAAALTGNPILDLLELTRR